MLWEAANVKRDFTQETEGSRNKSCETVEAALSRLTRAYKLAMACIGALHKAHSMALKNPEQDVSIQRELHRVAIAARTTFERSILMDPLIAKHYGSTWLQTVQDFAKKDAATFGFVFEARPASPDVKSTSHQTTVREIAYLALLNYADLLVACQIPNQASPSMQVLDKGVVPPLSLIRWDCIEDLRLALVALCDASDLEDSDPVLWLKLACAARGLSRRLQLTNPDPSSPLEFQRLERHALERGSLVLPSHLPPNRLIAKARREILEMPILYSNKIAEQPEPNRLVLDLPRYSWSILGRLLMRACREGMINENNNLVGVPLIEMTISPILVLPPTALATICTFLENRSIWRFESTCRGLSASIVSARTSFERRENMRTTIIVSKQEAGNTDEGEQKTVTNAALPHQPVPGEDSQAASKERSRARSSKRVQSQLITSGKRAERESKRNSVEFCLLASVLNTTADSEVYHDMRRFPIDWDALVGIIPSLSIDEIGKQMQSSKAVTSRQQAEERLGDSCLSAFINKWSASNSGPFDVLAEFVYHVAMNASEIFSSDASDSIVLSNMFLDCIDILAQRTGRRNAFDLCWFGPTIEAITTTERKVRSLCVNLLSAELRLRRCEDDDFEVPDFDSDANTTSLLLPALLSGVDTIILAAPPELSNILIALKARCQWFAAGYYLWRSRKSHNVRESKEAESFALDQINDIIVTLRVPHSSFSGRVSTPHLTSPRRSDAIWRNLSEMELHRFRDEIQAAAVVSSARQSFQERFGSIRAHWETTDSPSLRDDDLAGLSDIGKELLKRYDLSSTRTNSRFEELVDDFLSTFNQHLVGFLDQDRHIINIEGWGDLWVSLPLSASEIAGHADILQPSILTIYCSCLQAGSNNNSLVLKVLTRLIHSSFRQQTALLTKLSEQDIKKKCHLANADFSDDDSFSDDEMDFSCLPVTAQTKNCDEKKILVISVFIEFVMHKMTDFCMKNFDAEWMTELRSSRELISSVHVALGFLSVWYTRCADNRILSQHLSLDSKLFVRIQALVDVCRGSFQAGNVSDLDKAFFVGMARVIVVQRSALPLLLHPSKANRMGRAVRQKACMSRASLIATVGAEIARRLSKSPVTVVGKGILHTGLLLAMIESDTSAAENTDIRLSSSIGTFVESLLWFWTNVIGSNVAAGVGTSLERLIADELSVPVAAMLISLCGAGLSIVPQKTKASCSGELLQSQLVLGEFFDSDASANGYESDDESTSNKAKRRDILLRCTSQAVQCIAVVFARVNEKQRVDCTHERLLPLIVTRALSSLSDLLLVEFCDDQSKEHLWAEEYPFGTRTTGILLDTTLHKAYKHLYGFTITSSSKESTHSSDDQHLVKSVPESPDAAAQLYRCIRRTYSTSRKSPPKSALECVASSLPPAVETATSKAVRNFVFYPNKLSFLSKEIKAVVSRTSGWTSLFEELELILRRDGQGTDDLDEDDMMTVRKGIYSELAKGSLPSLSSGSIDTHKSHRGDDPATADERSVVAQNEQSVSRKFRCILDNLSFGDTDNAEGWAGAAQCLQLKADAIADRIGYSEGFSRSLNFSVPSNREQAGESMTFPDLMAHQERDCHRNVEGWVPFVGDDLSLYVDYSWSSLKSLNIFFQKLRPKGSFESQILSELRELLIKGDVVLWQQALGGMFVESLRRIATKCLSVALFLLDARKLRSPDDDVLKSEILESLGTLYYSKLMGNQAYGYPLRILTDHLKRDLSNTARLCFQTALETINSTGDADDNSQVTWDLHFMIGKCQEKTAKTYSLEKFPAVCEMPQERERAYERHLQLALNSYATALEQAQAQQKDGGSDIQAGGSSHGAVEVLYRLHASRLKCLLAGVQKTEDERNLAESEALRLTECHWFNAPDAELDADLRRRVWKVIADVVSALAQCRLEQPFFHRSVYRYAQALMWAPVFDNPSTGYGLGSLGTVPATKSYLVRGLNNATPCANSAEVIMATLFEKKRPQLCAVWVTSATSSPSPFELLNNSIRKYDSVRGKYIFAYLECLRICRRTSDLETFQQWVAVAKRDLPSFYQASALKGGGLPDTNHNRESLLLKGRSVEVMTFIRTVKRQINRALADIVAKEFHSAAIKECPDFLKRSYACFLRLNCEVVELEKTREWKFGRSPIPEVEALCQIYQARKDAKLITSPSNNWSGGSSKSVILEAALEKCRELFPMLSTTLFAKRKKKATPKPLSFAEDDPDSKRSAPDDDETKEFVVDVPRGLEVGEKFQTTIQIGHQLKTIRLTVPAGNPEKLKFTMKTSKTGEREDMPLAKRLKTEESDDPT